MRAGQGNRGDEGKAGDRDVVAQAAQVDEEVAAEDSVHSEVVGDRPDSQFLMRWRHLVFRAQS